MQVTKSDAFLAIQKAHGAYLDLVVNPENWKLPIDAIVECPIGVNVHDLAASIEEAINFMVGGMATITTRDNKLRVSAPGYYKIIGS